MFFLILVVSDWSNTITILSRSVEKKLKSFRLKGNQNLQLQNSAQKFWHKII